MKQYRLGSSAAVYAPGIVRWAINGAHFEKDRAQMIETIAGTWSVPPGAAKALVMQDVPYTVEGETVVFAAGDTTA